MLHYCQLIKIVVEKLAVFLVVIGAKAYIHTSVSTCEASIKWLMRRVHLSWNHLWLSILVPCRHHAESVLIEREEYCEWS